MKLDERRCDDSRLPRRREAVLAAAIVSSFIVGSLLAGEEKPADTKALPAATFSEGITVEDEAAILNKLKERLPRDVAVEKAIAYLVSKQNQDGSFGERHQVALTGLTVMALMASGHTPDEGQHGPVIRRAVNYVLSKMREDGYMGQADHSRMYGHGICTLMLTEVAGMTRDPVLERRLVEACRRAVKLILTAQALEKGPVHQGGWRYEPNSRDSDLSLTGWVTMALRSAKNIGMEVPGAAIQSAVDYIRRCGGPKGGFGYHGPEDRATLRGIGLLALPVCGAYDAPELKTTTALMHKDPPKWQGPWFFYRTYYAAVGMYQMGDEAWNRFYPGIDDLLLKHQNADGSWPEAPGNNEGEHGPIYRTTMVVLALTVHHHLLPIYQR